MRALEAQVRVAEATGEVELELINFAIEAGAQVAARVPGRRRCWPRALSTDTSSRGPCSGDVAPASPSPRSHRYRR